MNPAVAGTVIGCEGERVRERRHCASCVEYLRTGLVLCLPCVQNGAAHPVQLLHVTWDADGREEEIGPDGRLRTSVRTEVVPDV